MACFDLLRDYETNDMQFNGPLEEYIDSYQNELSEFNDLFKELIKIIPDVRILTNYTREVNQTIPSNIVIKYKDAFKLNGHPVKVPAIIYFKKDEMQRAVVLSNRHYIEAKGLYCCITEPQSEFEEVRDEMIALPLKYDNEKLLKSFKEIYDGVRLMSIKKSYDHDIFNSVDEMKEMACEYSRECFENDKQMLEEMENKHDYIMGCVVRTFLLKKAVYVQYMSSKDLLANRHEGNVQEQRRFAKTYASDIPFIPIGRLFHPERYEEESDAE